jgi:hypothetical protein
MHSIVTTERVLTGRICFVLEEASLEASISAGCAGFLAPEEVGFLNLK